MCLFTHFAAGALAGGVTGNIYVGAVAGLASHAVLDAIPHYDHPDWRLELAGGVASLILLLLLPFGGAAAMVGGICGMVPDLENLFQKLGWMGRNRFLFPSHTGLVPHGRELGPRTLVWQAAIFVGCFALLGLVAPGDALAATPEGAVMARPVMRTVSADAGRTVVRVEFPVKSAPADWTAVTLENVHWARGMDAPRADEPQRLPHESVALAVPTRRAPQVRVSGVEWWRRPDRPVDLDALLVAGPPAVQRGVPITGLDVPVGAAGGVLAAVTLEFLHPADVRGREQLAAAESGRDLKELRNSPFTLPGLANPALHATLLAGDLSLAAAKSGATDKAGPTDLFALTQNWVRLGVSETGLYRFTGQQLENLGVPTTTVDPAKLRVYRGGGVHIHGDPELPDEQQSRRLGLNEVAIRVVESTPDGEWNLDDEVRFYGVATSAYLDRLVPGSDRTVHYDHPYCNEAVYWLTWEDDAAPTPLPGTPRRVVEVASPAGAGPVRTAGTTRLHMEEQLFDERGLVLDNWVWDYDVTGTETESFMTHRPASESTARFQVEVRAGTRVSHTASAYLNVDESAADTLTFVVNRSTTQERFLIAGETGDIRTGVNFLILKNLTLSGSQLVFDSFDVFYEDSLVLENGYEALQFALEGDDVPSPATLENLRVATATPQVTTLWDVTVPDSAVVLLGTPAVASVDWEVSRDPGVDRFFMAAETSGLRAVTSAARERPASLADLDTQLDYIVLAPASFMSAAWDLADYRARDLYGVSAPRTTAVDVQAVYDNFSGGQKDLLALRTFLQWVWEQGGHRLGYVCLIGNTSRDPRNHRGATPYVDFYDFVPTCIRSAFPRERREHVFQDAYASDDDIVSFDTAPDNIYLGVEDRDMPEVVVGRLPAVTVTEAGDMVDRAVAYGESPEPGTWRNRVLVASDDLYYTTYPGAARDENYHVAKAEDVTEDWLPPALDVVKVYGVDYDFPPGSNIKSAAQRDIKAALNEGTSIFYYVGHGSEDNLGDEQYFRLADISNLVNGGRRPLFVAFSCDVGVYDSFLARSMAEQFVATSAGGAAVSICASQVSYVSPNNIFTDDFFQALYPGAVLLDHATVGKALLAAKGASSSNFSRNNSQRYNILGDPALRFLHPARGLEFAPGNIDTLRPGLLQRVQLDGAAQTPMLGAGDAWDLRVEESTREEHFEQWDWVYDPEIQQSPWIRVEDGTFIKRGSAAFRTSGIMDGSLLSVPFKATTQSQVGERGRIRLISDERVAVTHIPVVRADLSTVDDVIGPQISLNFADNRTRVTPGAELQATLVDSSSIAVLGNAPGNSINLEFDDSGYWTDVTDAFIFAPDDHTRGQLVFDLPADLDPGRHVAALYAADAFGNVGADTLSFTLLAGGTSGIFDATLFPNPTPGPCRLIFELGTGMVVRWDVYTTAGRRVRTMHPGALGAGPQVLHWDGRDQEGDEMANGTYLFVLRGLGGGHDGSDLIRTGKLVIMR
ncbi:MAG: hypothetical protein GY838_12265 [bacterium]|nr:hypothetical protein [bacterium]